MVVVYHKTRVYATGLMFTACKQPRFWFTEIYGHCVNVDIILSILRRRRGIFVSSIQITYPKCPIGTRVEFEPR